VRELPRILLLEPYYGGSHRAFLSGLQQHVACCFTLLTLPARKWKMRMQLAAPWFAEQIHELVESGERFDAILTSTFLDTAVLRSLLAAHNIHLPLGIYFHENQFSYPGQVADPGIFQFTSINFTSALCADRLAFNSRYNLETFLAGIGSYLKKATDMDLAHLEAAIEQKSRVLHPGMDFSLIDAAPPALPDKIPVIVWNHRWEHDKDPETFFAALAALKDLPFKLIVLGQRFRRVPEIFARAEQELAGRILHFGYVEDRQEYARLLRRGDIVVSTARHEFFGMAVLEGVRAGCRPLVPDRLAYRELFPAQYRYPENGLRKELARLLAQWPPAQPFDPLPLTGRYGWPALAPAYQDWLTGLCATP
jgi:glycosyltransferase involved in cell wall biosynthesis